ncbi:hypothetical protein, partial [Yoonia sp.]|uniref:helix-turn-helix domain-containing protein n=1 Tax=Yoonia sp. TaxID=2212373 RepID=UPI002E0AA1F5|nr:hypothetical protein [Yoonia sp.]
SVAIHDDLFAMTDADHAKMRAIARRQVHAPIEARKATRVTPAQPVKMIEAMSNKPAPQLPKPTKIDGRTINNAMQQQMARQRVIDVLTEPMTEREIAERLDRSMITIFSRMKEFEAEGLVTCETFPNRADGRQVPRKWSRTGKPLGDPPKKSLTVIISEQSEKNRAAVLGALDEPRAGYQVAEMLGMRRHTVSGIMRNLARLGLIREGGIVRTSNNKPVTAWVRA